MGNLNKNLPERKFTSLTDLYNEVQEIKKLLTDVYNLVHTDGAAVSGLISSSIPSGNYIRRNTAYQRYKKTGAGLTKTRLQTIIDKKEVDTIEKSDSRVPGGIAVLLNEQQLVELLSRDVRNKIIREEKITPQSEEKTPYNGMSREEHINNLRLIANPTLYKKRYKTVG